MDYRCAGPNCGVQKGTSDGWWLIWTSFGEASVPLLYLAPWDDALAQQPGVLPTCGERCAQKLQSQFMGNVRDNLSRKTAE